MTPPKCDSVTASKLTVENDSTAAFGTGFVEAAGKFFERFAAAARW
jgi:hypothetical protein